MTSYMIKELGIIQKTTTARKLFKLDSAVNALMKRDSKISYISKIRYKFIF